MNKIKKLFSGMIDAVKDAFNTFPLTILLVYVLTLVITFLMIGTDFPKEVDKVIAHIVFVGMYTACGTVLAETLFEKKDLRRVFGYVISFIIAFGFDRLIAANTENTKALEILLRWNIEYTILCALTAIYMQAKKAKVNFERYVLNVLYNIKRAGIIYGIIALGFLFLYLIFTILILEDVDFKIYLKILSLFTGFYLIPVALKAFANEEAEDTKFSKTVFTKVLLPLVFLSMLIVYIYIAKILVITEMPKNQIFSILSVIFVCAFPVYVINKNYSDTDSILVKMNKLIPYLFSPFIILQVYTMGIRVNEYGITYSRYMAITLIVFEIMVMFLSIFKNSKYLSLALLGTIAISFVAVVSPYNFSKAPILSQKRIVNSYISSSKSFNELDDYDKRRFASAYQYIDDYDWAVSDLNLSKEQKEVLSSYSTYVSRYNTDTEKEERKIEYIRYDKPFDDIDITGYKRVYTVPNVYTDEGTKIKYDRFKEGSYTYLSNKYDYDLEFEVDIAQYAKQVIEAYNISDLTGERIFKEELSTVKIDENRELYITQISITYFKKEEKIDHISLEGYVLEK